ncbi:hypothetical protein PULV_a3712 [Pseudoalteromonas ulvae UL12]|uniref:Uncharacterized protein n=1 Tax=Pseudoalteromonas ulvae TaxID=107327 RepID=A0A244CKT0_PSEDV|nr:DUF6289 family protein [Pseudoalteromonas ulvae]MBE0362031.1 hypothetical protein [Pseudoalteromonas ulvae UL12]OUL55981.1 hypothetical protein B1199_19965 [Pseudoalteromonas ulvae]
MKNKMKKSLVVAGSALALLGGSFAIAGSNARIIEYVYYADSTYSTVVGESIQNCDGRIYTTGQTTPYKRLVGAEPCRGFGW